MHPIITINHLQKHFGDVHAVRDLSLQVRQGELFAFLGVNGAGKSTTISILCGLLPKDAGSVTVDGIDLDSGVREIRKRLGVVFQNSVLDAALTVRQNLTSRGALYGICGKAIKDRIQALSALLDFADFLDRPVGKLSGGQRRRIDIARALIHQPEILILDEPTTGLDPQTRQRLWQVIGQLRKHQHMTVFLTTHYMEEAAESDYIVILDDGAIAAKGTPLELKNAYASDYFLLYHVTEAQVQQLGLPYTTIRDAYRVPVADSAAATQLILQHPALFVDYELYKGKMDDVFLAVTQKTLTGGAAIC